MPLRDIRIVEMECCNCGKVVKATNYANKYNMNNIRVFPLQSDGHICKPTIDRAKPVIDEYICDECFTRINDIIYNKYYIYILTVSLIETNVNNGRNISKTYYLGDNIENIKSDDIYDSIVGFITSSKTVNYINIDDLKHNIDVMVTNMNNDTKYDDTTSYNDKWYTLSIFKINPLDVQYKELEVYQSEGE